MTSLNAAAGPGNNHQNIAQLQNVQRPQVQVPASSVRDTADSFTSSFKQKVSGIEDPKTLYTVRSRYDQLSEKLSAGATTQPDRSGPPPSESAFSASAPVTLLDGPASPTGAKLDAPNGPDGADAADEDQAGQAFTMDDLRAARDLIGAREGDENFDPQYDIDEDGEISFTDLVGMLSRFGPSSEQGADTQ